MARKMHATSPNGENKKPKNNLPRKDDEEAVGTVPGALALVVVPVLGLILEPPGGEAGGESHHHRQPCSSASCHFLFFFSSNNNTPSSHRQPYSIVVCC
jgi:hypothetical protein